MADRYPTVVINPQAPESFTGTIGLPQISPILPYMVIFAITSTCWGSRIALVEVTSALRFVDNVNILVYSISTEENIDSLESNA